MDLKKHKILILISLFAISMGIFESAIVVYLRELYYPLGFVFPLMPIDNHIAITELIREFASLIMLLSIGFIAGKNFSQGFAWFIYSFAIWDIVYYLFLYLILSWPKSLFTWDILFLLPITWTGPVIAPIIISFLMILLALSIYKYNIKNGFKVKILRKEWTLLITGSIIIFISFIWDYCRFLSRNISLNEFKNKALSDKLFNLSLSYIPEKFPWLIFTIGTLIICSGIILLIIRNKKNLYKK